MPSGSLDIDAVNDLRALALRFGGEHLERKSQALAATATRGGRRRGRAHRLSRLPAVPARVSRNARTARQGPRRIEPRRRSRAQDLRRRTVPGARAAREQRHRPHGGHDQLRLGHRPLARRAFPEPGGDRFLRRARRGTAGGPRRGARADGIRACRLRGDSARVHQRRLGRKPRHAPRVAHRGGRATAVQRCAARSSVRQPAAIRRHPARPLDALPDLCPWSSGPDLLSSRRAPAPGRPQRTARPSVAGATPPFGRRTAARRRCRARDAGGSRPGDRCHRARVPQGCPLFRARPRPRHRSLPDAARAAEPARLAYRHDAVQERGAGRLRRRLAAARHVQDRRQRVRPLPGRGIRPALRAGAACLPAMLRDRAIHRRTLAVRRHEQGGIAVRRVLVLLPSRIPPRRPAIGAARERGVGAHRGRPRTPHAGRRAAPVHRLRHRACDRPRAGLRARQSERPRDTMDRPALRRRPRGGGRGRDADCRSARWRSRARSAGRRASAARSARSRLSSRRYRTSRISLPRTSGALVSLLRAKGGDEFRFHARLARHRCFAPRSRYSEHTAPTLTTFATPPGGGAQRPSGGRAGVQP